MFVSPGDRAGRKFTLGKSVQTVYLIDGARATGSTTIPLDNTIPQNTEGDQYLSLSITPTRTSNYLKIDVVVNLGSVNAVNSWVIAALFQDTTADALAVGWQTSELAQGSVQVNFSYIMIAGTTLSTTFKVRAGCNGGGTTEFNGRAGSAFFNGKLASSIIITEFQP